MYPVFICRGSRLFLCFLLGLLINPCSPNIRPIVPQRGLKTKHLLQPCSTLTGYPPFCLHYLLFQIQRAFMWYSLRPRSFLEALIALSLIPSHPEAYRIHQKILIPSLSPSPSGCRASSNPNDTVEKVQKWHFNYLEPL